jgi:defect in organelle trafficking protein DotA
VKMPDLSDAKGSYYKDLTGICGTIAWAPLTGLDSSNLQNNYGMTQTQTETMQNTRAIAVQQMYEWLSSVAVQIVSNDPQIANSATGDPKQQASVSALSQFGFALDNNKACSGLSQSCTSWGADYNLTNSSGNVPSVMFAGNEFPNAIASYDGVMGPTLNFINESKDQSTAQALRDFIEESKNSGWLMAGSYFYNMIALSGSKVGVPMPKDTGSGLDKSISYALPSSSSTCTSSKQSTALCNIYKGTSSTYDNVDFSSINAIQNLISGKDPGSTSSSNCGANQLQESSFDSTYGYISPHNISSATVSCASTVYGFIANSFYVYTPGQTLPSMSFPDPGNIGASQYPQDMNFSTGCFNMKFFMVSVCIKAIGQLVSQLMQLFWNWFMKYLFYYLGQAIQAILIKPLINIAWPMLEYALEQLNNQSLNPIVNLGNMGVTLINYIMVLFMVMLAGFLASLIFPPSAILVLTIVGACFPLIASFFALFISIGFICAYYVPLLPYMIFTFGTLGWFMAVIEAMVAGPIVALGVMTPEGEGMLGKAEQGMMILVNVFLRPSMMIIGFVMGSVLTYVFVWVVGEGYHRAAQYLLAGNCGSSTCMAWQSGDTSGNAAYTAGLKMDTGTFSMIFGGVTYSLMYVFLYQTVVEKSFDLIHLLPDQILRWIGGHPEQYGSQTKDWAQGAKEKVQKMEESGTKAMAESGKNIEGGVDKYLGSKKKKDQEGGSPTGGAGPGAGPGPGAGAGAG